MDDADERAAIERIREGSKLHRSYPATQVKPIAYWAGLEAALHHHRSFLRNMAQGRLVIFYGGQGTGKSYAINALIHGNTEVRPERSLTVRFDSFVGISDERAILLRIAEMLQFPVERERRLHARLAQFIIDAVVKDEKKRVSGFRDTVTPLLQKMGTTFLSVCGVKDIWEDEEKIQYPMEILGMPEEQTEDIQSKPIIVFDNVDVTIQQNGPLADFFRTIGSMAQDINVICYVITNNRLTAYRIWQQNGGNWIQPHRAVAVHIGRQATLAEWANTYERGLDEKEVAELNARLIPDFYFSKNAFELSKENRKTLLWNTFSRSCKDPIEHQQLQQSIDEVVESNPGVAIKVMMSTMNGLGYSPPDAPFLSWNSTTKIL